MREFLGSPLFAIFLIVFVDVLGVGITVPVLPLFAQDELGAGAFEIGLLSTIYFIVQAFAAPTLGRMSDKLGRRPVLIFSQIGTLLALLLSAWAPSLLWLFVARALDGLTGGNITVAFAYVGDVSKPEQRARSMGVISAGFGAGFMFGPAIGGFLGGLYGPRAPFLAAACVSLITITLSVIRLKEPPKHQETPATIAAQGPSTGAKMSFGQVLKLPGVTRLITIGFFTQLAMLCFTSMWVLWADAVVLTDYDKGAQQRMVGWVFAVLGLFQLTTQAFIVGPLVKWVGEKRMVTLGLLTRGVSWIAMATSASIGFVFATLPTAAIGSGVAQPAMMALLTFSVPAYVRGQALGVMSTCESIGRMAGPLLAGLLYKHVAPGAPISVAGGLSIVAALLALTIRVNKPATQPMAEQRSTA
jgi:DHA1 family tetracycline resistance protein-like MFS transporter